MAASDGDTEGPVRDHHFYNDGAYQSLTDGRVEFDRLDVNDLVGADGVRLVPNHEDLQQWRALHQRPDFEPNALLLAEVHNLYAYAEDQRDEEGYLGARRDFELGAADILRQLADRLAPVAANVFRERLDQLMEPVRSVGIACLMLHMEHQAVARHLQTSVETVAFLVEVALSHLEPLVEFRSTRPVPPRWQRSSDVPQSLAE
jgi:hypothetical protein